MNLDINDLYFEPYPEVDFRITDKKLSVTSPWIMIDVEVDEDLEKLHDIVNSIEGNVENFKRPEVQEFLRFFVDYPISFMKVKKPNASIPQKGKCKISDYIPSKMELLKKVDPSIDETFLERMGINKKWNNSISDALNFSHIIDDKYSPIALYSYLNYLMFVTDYTGEPVYEKLNELKQNNESDFFEVVKLILRQSYYITSNCCDSISPAIELSDSTRDLAINYEKSERGHHMLVERSFSALCDDDISKYKLFDQTQFCMTLLKYTAQNSMMSFASSLTAFESSGFGEEDQIARLLRASSKPLSANGLDKHFEINAKEGHAMIGLEFVKLMDVISRDDVISACIAIEVQTELGHSSQNKVMEYIKSL